MATVKPFKGLRPPRELVTQVASRPYDVLNSEEARAEAEGNPRSLYHIIKPEIDFEPGTDEHDPKVYDKAVENFRMFQDKGWLVSDDSEHYYIYAQTMDGRTQYGIVVAASVDDYMNGRIKKHELTRRDKEEDRMKHVRVNNANIEPVFFAFPDNEILEKIISDATSGEPEYDFTAPDGFGHRFWVIDDESQNQVIGQKECAGMCEGRIVSVGAFNGVGHRYLLRCRGDSLAEEGDVFGAVPVVVAVCVVEGIEAV